MAGCVTVGGIRVPSTHFMGSPLTTIVLTCLLSAGLLLLCQHHYCDELSTPSLVSSSSDSETQDETTARLSTTFKTQSSLSAQNDEVPLTKTSVVISTTTHTTRLQRITHAPSDEALIDVTTIDSLCLTRNYEADDTADENYSIKSIGGDIIVTIILNQSDNATEIIKFIVNHINGIDLLVHNVTIGARIVEVTKKQSLLDILENEIDYLEHCVDNPFGIFLSNELWHDALLKGKEFEFKIWPLPALEVVKARKVAHLLNELPLPASRRNASVELKADSMNRTAQFKSVLKSENLCFKTSSSGEKILVYIGDAEFLNAARFSSNESLIIVPLTMRDLVMSDIPNHSYVAVESEIDSNHLKNFTNASTSPSEFITIASTFLEVCKSVNNAIWKNCNHTSLTVKIDLTKCEIFDDLHVPENISTTDVMQMLKLLQLDGLANQMTYNIFEKFTSNADETNHSSELKKIATTNFVTNVTTIYMPNQLEMIALGSLLQCEKPAVSMNSSQNSSSHHHHINSFDLDERFPPEVNGFELDSNGDMAEVYNWQIKTDLWVAIGLTIATLGILLCMAILTFVIVRICMEDVLEGNPIGSIVMLLALIAQFASFFPFTIEYTGFRKDLHNSNEAIDVFNSMCIIRIFVVSVCYCLTFSLLLSRAIMLASIGSEGGFLSHVNGYIQSIICIFSFLVQLGLSTQLLIMMHAQQRHVTCETVYYGNWFWGIIGYDLMLLLLLALLTPFIFRSQRNYREGMLIVITSILCLACWAIWIPLSMINNNLREMMIPLGVQATGWIILASLMVPRCFLIVRSIARSDFTQALPSLTSLAFAQANQFISEPSIYECVNPTMRSTRSNVDENSQTNINEYLSPSEVPTLPLRGGGGRRNLIEHYNLNFNEIHNPDLPSPNKMTRF